MTVFEVFSAKKVIDQRAKYLGTVYARDMEDAETMAKRFWPLAKDHKVRVKR